MLESVRRQYLQAMGISLWLPRESLAHSAPSRLLPLVGSRHVGPDENRLAVVEAVEHRQASGLLPAAVGNHSTAASARERTAGPQPVATLVAEAVRPRDRAVAEPPASPVEERPATPVVEEAAAPVDLTPPRFQLLFVRVGGAGVWVCDRPEAVPDMQRLAARVASVMAMEQVQTEVSEFHWPFIENAREDQSVMVARQALRAQWQHLLSQGVRYAIAMGPDASHWLPQSGAEGLWLAEPVTVILGSAAHKRRLWQFIHLRSQQPDGL